MTKCQAGTNPIFITQQGPALNPVQRGGQPQVLNPQHGPIGGQGEQGLSQVQGDQPGLPQGLGNQPGLRGTGEQGLPQVLGDKSGLPMAQGEQPQDTRTKYGPQGGPGETGTGLPQVVGGQSGLQSQAPRGGQGGQHQVTQVLGDLAPGLPQVPGDLQ